MRRAGPCKHRPLSPRALSRKKYSPRRSGITSETERKGKEIKSDRIFLFFFSQEENGFSLTEEKKEESFLASKRKEKKLWEEREKKSCRDYKFLYVRAIVASFSFSPFHLAQKRKPQHKNFIELEDGNKEN